MIGRTVTRVTYALPNTDRHVG